jgi:UDP-N-acetylmuramoyl-L-alanyl-D-glutamate--2,6-diaminopimelate ligase
MRLANLLANLPIATTLFGESDPDITHITADSRQAGPGAAFVAVRGETVDGHRFMADAAARGAAVVVGEAPPAAPLPGPFVQVADSKAALAWLSAAWHDFPARKLVMIGVTGTDGKTTTATLIYHILLAAGVWTGLISTVAAYIGDETLDTGFHVTTPDAPEVQSYLARMVAAGLTHCVLEVTSHGLAQQRVTGCEFDVAVVTNITHEHLDYHKTYENYRAAKGLLFESLTTAYQKGVSKTAILNRDDSAVDYLQSLSRNRTLLYSLRGEADFVAFQRDYQPAGLNFRVTTPKQTALAQTPFTTTLVGDYNISNCLAAIAATVGGLGIDPMHAAQGIAALRGVPGRMERIDLGQRFTAIVDFAHTPNALKRALETGRQILRSAERPGRLITVFGAAGLRDVEKRRLMAETSAELADISILTAEDPRTESLDAILEMMAFGAKHKGGVEGATFFRVPDRGEAIRFALRLAQPGDMVLACGKGHEQSMCFGTTEYAWDDRTAMRAALAERLGVPGPAMPFLPTAGGK